MREQTLHERSDPEAGQITFIDGGPRDLSSQEWLYLSMSGSGQLRRFENRAQLLRHIAEETGTDIDTLWDEYEAQVE